VKLAGSIEEKPGKKVNNLNFCMNIKGGLCGKLKRCQDV